MSKSYKIVVIGAGGVGKSCFTIQLISGTFVETYDPTLEDSYRKQMTIDGEESILNIYDTAGQEDFSAVRDQYIRIGEGFLCLYSITTEASFQEVNNLRDKLCNITEEEDHPVVLVGNKADLEEDREVTHEEGQELANQFKWKFMEASAKTKTNVVEAFEEIVKSIRFHRINGGDKDPDEPVAEKKAEKPSKRRCLLL